MKTYETDRFLLKEIVQEDIHHIHKGLSDESVTQYYAVHFPTLEATQEQMDWYANLKATETGLWWGIYTKDTNEFCGAGGYNDLDKINRKAEIGFWLLPEFWGKGILKEVMPQLFQMGFTDLNLHRIEGFVEADNAKCRRALEKVNFTHEGTMRQCEIKNDKYIDVAIYAIINE